MHELNESTTNCKDLGRNTKLVSLPKSLMQKAREPGNQRASQSGQRACHSGQRVSHSGQRASHSVQRASYSGQRASHSGQIAFQSRSLAVVRCSLIPRFLGFLHQVAEIPMVLSLASCMKLQLLLVSRHSTVLYFYVFPPGP